MLCTCGRITSVKGFDLAVGAAALLKKKGLSFKWYFVGDGADREKIEKLIAEKQLSDCIEITGLQSNPYPYIKNCDIYVQPSYEEAHSLSIIEACILCKPVVSTATAGGKSIISNGTNGLLCDISPSAISDAIIKFTNDGGLREQIKENLSRIDYEKSCEKYKSEWIKLLEE